MQFLAFAFTFKGQRQSTVLHHRPEI